MSLRLKKVINIALAFALTSAIVFSLPMFAPTARAATYNVTHTLTNITSPAEDKGAGKADDTADYDTTLTPATGYSLPTAIEVKVGSAVLAAADYAYDSSSGDVSIPKEKLTGNITLTAAGTANTYTVTLDNNGGIADVGTAEVVAAYGAAMPYASMPERDGYTFEGYYDTNAATGGTQYYTASGASAKAWDKAADTTLYARWTATAYSITYVLDGGELGTGVTNPTTYDITTAAFSLHNPTKKGYDFAGWSGTGLNGDANTNVTIAAGSTGAKTYVANWTIKSGTLEVVLGVGESWTLGSGPFTQDYGTTLALPVPEKTGHVFEHWNLTTGTPGEAGALISANTYKFGETDDTLTATWLAKTDSPAFGTAGGGNLPGTYATDSDVKAVFNTASGVDIYYTTNGDAPDHTKPEQKYSGAITINTAQPGTVIVKAIAVTTAPGVKLPSDAVAGTYTIVDKNKVINSSTPAGFELQNGFTYTVSASSVTKTGTAEKKNALAAVQNAVATLAVPKGYTLNLIGGSGGAGLFLSPGAKLTLNVEGTLNATGGAGYAGIHLSPGSSLVINVAAGGTLEAQGSGGAGIHVSYGSALTVDELTLNVSGTLNAEGDTSNAKAAGIYLTAGASSTIDIKAAGTLTSAGGDNSAGIHVGKTSALTASLKVTGDGELNATGGAAGIGGSNDTSDNNCGSVELNCAAVNATSTGDGAGIGGGRSGSGGTVRILRGTVQAHALSGDAADVGAGRGGTGNGSLSVTSGASVMGTNTSVQNALNSLSAVQSGKSFMTVSLAAQNTPPSNTASSHADVKIKSVSLKTGSSTTNSAMSGVSTAAGGLLYLYLPTNSEIVSFTDVNNRIYRSTDTVTVAANGSGSFIYSKTAVALDAAGGTPGTRRQLEANYGSALPRLYGSELPTKEGYNFSGYYYNGAQYIDNSGSATTRKWSVTDHAATLTAQWTPKEYKVRFNANAPGTVTLPSTISVNSSPYRFRLRVNTDEAKRTGYDFLNWKDGSGRLYFCDNTYYPISADLHLYAQWKVQEYDINYVLDGGTLGANSPAKHTYGTATTLFAPTKDNKTFGGWFTTSAFTGTALTTLAADGYTGNITLYAKWNDLPPAPPPTFSAAPGSYNTAQTVRLTPASGTTVYYTTDGSDPDKTNSAQRYAAGTPIAVGAGTTVIKTLSVKSGCEDNLVVSEYKILNGPTGSGANFFANGTPITIEAAAPTGGTAVTLAGFTATGTDAYICWGDGAGGTNYIGVRCADNAEITNGCVVYGGSDGSAQTATVQSTSVTMNGGTIQHLYAGNLGKDSTILGSDKTLDPASAVKGNAVVTINGGEVHRYVAAGEYNASVEGEFILTVNGGAAGQIEAGIRGNGKEGLLDTTAKTITTNAFVKKATVKINALSGTAWNTVKGGPYVAAGGGGYTRAETVVMTVGDGAGSDVTIQHLSSGGVNGVTQNSTVTVNSDVTIDDVSASNRGYLNTGGLTVNGAAITNLYTGAVEDCFSSDGSDSSAVTGSMTITLKDASNISNIYITPNVNKKTGGYDYSINNLTIDNQSSTVIEPKFAKDFEIIPVVGSNPAVTTSDYLIASGASALVLKGKTEVTVPAGVTVTNNGKITVGSGTKLINDGDLIIGSSGTVANSGTITNNSVMESENPASWLTGSGSVANGWADISWYTAAVKTAKRYTIADAYDLAGLALLTNSGESFAGWTFTLAASINLNEFTSWTPIGDGKTVGTPPATVTNVFQGTVTGPSTGSTISNLKINPDTADCDSYGLFGVVSGASSFNNITLADVSVDLEDDDKAAGALIGSYKGTDGSNADNLVIKNVKTTGTGAAVKSGAEPAGGIVGQLGGKLESVAITNCSNAAAITGGDAGGIVGYIDGTAAMGGVTIRNSSNSGAVSGTNAGGMVGQSKGYLLLNSCKNTGAISGIAKAGHMCGTSSETGSLSASTCTSYLPAQNTGVVKKGSPLAEVAEADQKVMGDGWVGVVSGTVLYRTAKDGPYKAATYYNANPQYLLPTVVYTNGWSYRGSVSGNNFTIYKITQDAALKTYELETGSTPPSGAQNVGEGTRAKPFVVASEADLGRLTSWYYTLDLDTTPKAITLTETHEIPDGATLIVPSGYTLTASAANELTGKPSARLEVFGAAVLKGSPLHVGTYKYHNNKWTPLAEAPTGEGGEGNELFANGTAITIQSGVPSGTRVTPAGFTATGTAAYIRWNDSGATKYVGVNNTCVVYGGFLNQDLESTASITMTGGAVNAIYGGGKSEAAATPADVTNSIVNISGGTVTHLYGAGYGPSAVGSATVSISGGNVTNATAAGKTTFSGDSKVTNAVLNISRGSVTNAYGVREGEAANVTTSVTGGSISVVCYVGAPNDDAGGNAKVTSKAELDVGANASVPNIYLGKGLGSAQSAELSGSGITVEASSKNNTATSPLVWTKTLTINSGVTLSVPNNKSFTIGTGAAVTVKNGASIVIASGGTMTVNNDANTFKNEGTLNAAGALVLNKAATGAAGARLITGISPPTGEGANASTGNFYNQLGAKTAAAPGKVYEWSASNPTGWKVTTISVLRGDANLDGTVNILDATTALAYIRGVRVPTDAQKAATDVNDDGVINVLDVTTIISIIRTQS